MHCSKLQFTCQVMSCKFKVFDVDLRVNYLLKYGTTTNLKDFYLANEVQFIRVLWEHTSEECHVCALSASP